MAKGTADLFDAVDAEPTTYSALDWVIWALVNAGAFAGALFLFLTKRRIDAVNGGVPPDSPNENPIAQFARGIENFLSGDLLEVLASLVFVLCQVFVFMLQMSHRFQLRLLVTSVVLAGMYTGSLNGWLYNVPIFVWTGLLLSNVAQMVLVK